MIHVNKVGATSGSEARWLIESDGSMQACVVSTRELNELAFALAFRLGSATFIGRGSGGLVAKFERGDGRSAVLHLCYSDEVAEVVSAIKREFEA